LNIHPFTFAAGLWKEGTSRGKRVSLMFYNSVKHAAKSKIQKAETIYNDLVPRFPGRPKKDDSDQSTEKVS
jgi:hypothetical protein